MPDRYNTAHIWFLWDSNHSQLLPTYTTKTATHKQKHTHNSRHTFGQVAASSHKGSHYLVLMGLFPNTSSIGLLPYNYEVLPGPHTFLDLMSTACTGLELEEKD